ncbi:hypothetical protein NKG94_20855 [Micromonospora sp. M12]
MLTRQGRLAFTGTPPPPGSSSACDPSSRCTSGSTRRRIPPSGPSASPSSATPTRRPLRQSMVAGPRPRLARSAGCASGRSSPSETRRSCSATG